MATSEWTHGDIAPVRRSQVVEVDTVSSASRQHFIDTGRYLTVAEVELVELRVALALQAGAWREAAGRLRYTGTGEFYDSAVEEIRDAMADVYSEVADQVEKVSRTIRP